MKAGTQFPSPPVAVVVLTTKDAEGPDLVAVLREQQKKSKCKWSDFGILYRSHYQRDDVVQELAEAGNSLRHREHGHLRHARGSRSVRLPERGRVRRRRRQPVSRGRSAHAFTSIPSSFAQVMRAIARDQREGQIVPLSSALDRVDGGADVLAAVQRTREDIRRRQAKARSALDIIVKQFALDASSPILQAALKFVETGKQRRSTRPPNSRNWSTISDYFREAGGVIPLEVRRD